VVRSAPRIQRELLAGIEGITLKSLRKMFASRLVQAGEPIFTVSKLIGHASVVTTTTH
jgi:integrase